MSNYIDIHDALEELGELICDKMKEDVPVDTGKLRDSIGFYITKKNELIITMEDYGQAVNDGTKPHMPPVSSLQGWSKRKGLNPWAVATNISKYGTSAQPFMDDLDEFEKEYFDILDEGIEQAIEDTIYNAIAKLKK